ncbi:MAG: ABC transporter substrate-binding protein [Anaerolineales bacterium]|nr:ABC transporter substrate-binding protein [Anaerolineales bacterium]MDW8279149.1 ABC transporter substrate-binding protein [Anaerolineales bacterium]
MLRKFLFVILTFALLLVACAPAVTPTPAPTAVAPTQAPTSTVAPTQPAPVIEAPTENLTDGCIAEGQFDPGIDYFPQKAQIEYAAGLTIEYHNSYKVITVKTPWPGASESMAYALVQCGAPRPEGFLEEQIIEVPAKTIITMSTTYLPALDELGLLDRLVGVDDTTYVNNPTVLKMAEDGKLASIGYGSGVNVEKVLELSPSLVMTYGSGAPEYDAHPVLLQAGQKVVVNAEWMDTTPLGRAEWLKFIAVFFNKEAKAEALFDQIEQDYQKLVALTASVSQKPTVFTGSAYQGTWYMPGGQSFAAAFLRDAGANYLWRDDPSTGSLPLSFEAVFEKAKDADYWLNVGFVGALDDLKGMDPRYADFAAFQKGNVWNNDAKTNSSGGNDYYESAVLHPERVLADLIFIFHPDLLPNHQLVYYRQVK